METAARFLSRFERLCVSACAHIRDGDYDEVDLLETGGTTVSATPTEIAALIVYAKQTVFPVFAERAPSSAVPPLTGALCRGAIHAVHGPADAVKTALTLLAPRCLLPKEHIIYSMMTREIGGYRGCGGTAENTPLPPDCSLRTAGIADEEALLPLQMAYEEEEIRHTAPDKRVSRLNLARILKEERVLAAEINGRIVGKINTNARGFSRAQVGGVYVLPAFRNRGVAAALTGALAEELLAAGAGVSLFVRKENAPAYAAYTRAGFQAVGKYAIAYY
jgi:ribosomal protein S18 acetylase RimI-like enzyme